jgi:hypothetical protein
MTNSSGPSGMLWRTVKYLFLTERIKRAARGAWWPRKKKHTG